MSDKTQPAPKPAAQNPAENSPDFQPADLDDIGQDFLDSAPESEPEYVAKLQEELADEMGVSHSFQTGEAAPPEPELIRDKNGHIFDPEICKVDEQGNPTYTTTGLFDLKYGKKRKLLKKQIRVPKMPKQPEPQVQPGPEIPPPPDDAAITAATIDNLYWSGMGMFGAQKVDEISQAGQKEMADGFRQMDNVPKIPWWVGVMAIYGSTTAAILNQEQAKPMLEKIKDKFTLWGAKFLKWRGKKQIEQGA